MEAGAPPGARHWRPSSRAARNLAAGPLGLGSLAGEAAAGGSAAAAPCDALHAALVQKLQPLARGACPAGPLAGLQAPGCCGVEPGSRDSGRSDLSADARRAGWWLGEGPDSPGGGHGGARGLPAPGLPSSGRPTATALDAVGTPRTPNGHAAYAAPGADSVTPPGLPPGESLVTPPRGGAAAALRGVRRQLVQSFSDDDHLGVFDLPSPGDSPARPSPPGVPGAWAWPAGKGDGGGQLSPARAPASTGSPGSTGSPPSDGASCTGRSEYATPGARGAITPGRGASWRPPRPPSSAALRAFHGSKANLLAAAAAHKTPTSVLDIRPSPPSGASSASDGGALYDVALATPPRGAVAAAPPVATTAVVLRPRSRSSGNAASRGCSVLSSLGLACGVRARADPPRRSPPQPPPRVAPMPLQYVIPPVPLTASPAPRRWGAPGWGEDDAAAAAHATAAAAAARDGATPPGARRALAPRHQNVPPPPQRSDKAPRSRLCSVFG